VIGPLALLHLANPAATRKLARKLFSGANLSQGSPILKIREDLNRPWNHLRVTVEVRDSIFARLAYIAFGREMTADQVLTEIQKKAPKAVQEAHLALGIGQ
jgi:hypothetical protein